MRLLFRKNVNAYVCISVRVFVYVIHVRVFVCVYLCLWLCMYMCLWECVFVYVCFFFVEENKQIHTIH
jgi:hypothetical protein